MPLVTRVALAAASVAGGWLAVALPLLVAGWYRPGPAVPLCGAAALGAAVAVWRWSGRDGGDHAPREWVPLLLTLLVVAGFTALTWVTHASHVVVRRDPAAYALTADWIAQAGRLPIPAHGDLFGLLPGVRVSSPAYYAADHLHSVVPQFMTGLPLLLAPAGWVAGLDGILHANTVIGGVALLTAAGLAAAVAGRWAAPAAAALLAVIFPVLHATRTTLAEPAAMLLFLAGLTAVLAGMRHHHRRSQALLAAGGLLLGLSSLVRLDAFADLLPVVAWLAVLAARSGTRRARPVGVGLAVGVAYGVVDGLVLSRPYLAEMLPQLLAVAVGWVLVLGAGWWWLRHGGRLRRAGWVRSWRRWLPNAAAGMVVVGAVALAVRPLLQTVRTAHYRGAPAVAALQAHQGLPADPNRTYAEQSMHWLASWSGIPFVVLAVLGLAGLTRAALRRDPAGASTLVALAAGATTLRVLWYPGIMPDHPWADRRLVPVALPLLTVAVMWLLARFPAAARPVAVGALSVLPLMATAPLAGAGTERGEPAALERLCAALPEHPAVLVLGWQSSQQLPGSVRIRCGVPTAAIAAPDTVLVTEVARSVTAHGRRLVAVSRDPAVLTGLGLTPHHLLTLHTTEDARLLTVRPQSTQPFVLPLWTATVSPPDGS